MTHRRVRNTMGFFDRFRGKGKQEKAAAPNTSAKTDQTENRAQSAPSKTYETTDLFYAAYNGDLMMVRMLLSDGASPNVFVHGYPALYYPVVNNYNEVAIALLNAGADPNAITPEGMFPMYAAAENGNLTLIKSLLDGGAEIDKMTPKGCTALRNAAEEGHYDVVDYLLSAGADVNSVNKAGYTILDAAMRHGQNAIVNLIQERCPNAKTTLAQTQSEANNQTEEIDEQAALFERYAQRRRARLGYEADATAVTVSENSTPLDKYSDEATSTSLIQACKNGDFDAAMRLLKQGADPNAASSDGRTPLFYCSEVALISLLIHYGANVNAADNEGNTPLMAVLKGENFHSNGERAIMVLIESGADTDARNAEGLSACDIAASRKAAPTEFDQFMMSEGMDVELGGDEDMNAALAQGMRNAAEKKRAFDEKLSQQRARRDEWHREMNPFGDGDWQNVIMNCFVASTLSDIDVLKAHEDTVRSNITVRMRLGNMQEQTMLMAACVDASAEVVEYLLSLGADANQVDDTGQAPLRYAAVSWIDTEKKIELLLNAGADINHLSDDGSAALSDAAFHRNVAATRKLLAHGANVNNRDTQGYTALSWACGQGAPDADIVELLLRYGANVEDLYDMDCALQYLDYANGSGWQKYRAVWLRPNELKERYLYEHALLPAMMTQNGKEKFQSQGYDVW